MLVNVLIIHNPISPEISLKSHLRPTIPSLEASPNDDGSDDKPAVSSSPDHNEKDTTAWHLQLAKALLSMHHDMHVIISAVEELSDRDLENNIQDKRTRYEMMRIALLLNPSELPTCSARQSTDSYMDLKEFDDTVLSGQFRSTILRVVARLRRDLAKLRLALLSPSYRNQSLHYVQNYRQRVAQCLADIHAYLTEHPRTTEIVDQQKKEEDEFTKHRKTVNSTFAEMIARNPQIEQRLVDYRSKVKPNKPDRTHEFVSSPLILMSPKSYEKLSSVKENSRETVPSCVLADFPDLYREASEFFGFESLADNHS